MQIIILTAHKLLLDELTLTCVIYPPVLSSLQREELTEVILKLLVAWGDPLWHFHQSMAHHHDFNNFSSNKALEMSDMVHELRKGVEKVAEKVLHFPHQRDVCVCDVVSRLKLQ